MSVLFFLKTHIFLHFEDKDEKNERTLETKQLLENLERQWNELVKAVTKKFDKVKKNLIQIFLFFKKLFFQFNRLDYFTG